MEQNVYAPPVAVVGDDAVASTDARSKPFFVVGKAKFLTLFFLSGSLYMVPMLYMHWARFKRATKGDEWPVMRAFFMVFFMHSLAEEIDHRLTRAHIRHAWSPRANATVIVVLLIASRLIDRIGGQFLDDTTALAIALAVLPPLAWCMWQIQYAANLACEDPHADSNRRMTWVNWLFMVPLAVFWLLVLAGVMLPAGA